MGGLVVGLFASAPLSPVDAQETDGPPELDLLPATPGATMAYKLERTFLKVDVIHLSVRVDEPTAARLRDLVESEEDYPRNGEETVATTVVDAEEAVARVEFLRDIELDQFLEGVDEDLGKARDAGWVDEATFDEVTTGLREWFGFLEARGIKKGDELTYHMRGEQLRTTYRNVGESDLRLDQTDVGEQYVAAFWGGYYAPDTTFREGLAKSLWRRD